MNNLRAIRMRKGYTTITFPAQHLPHISRPQYSLFENSKALPVQKDLETICEALEASPTELFGVDIDLMQVQRRWEQGRGVPRHKVHQGNHELRARVEDEKRERFIAQFKALGYKNFGDYLERCAMPDLESRYVAAQISPRLTVAK